MLYNIEPDRSVTGGAWYSDQDFESEFIDILNQQSHRYLEQKAEAARGTKVNTCTNFLRNLARFIQFMSTITRQGGPIMTRNASYATSKEIWKYISDLGISKVSLSLEDIEMILDTLVYDGKVEKSAIVESGDQVKTYRAVETLLPSAGIVRLPCGVCPVKDSLANLANLLGGWWFANAPLSPANGVEGFDHLTTS